MLHSQSDLRSSIPKDVYGLIVSDRGQKNVIDCGGGRKKMTFCNQESGDHIKPDYPDLPLTMASPMYKWSSSSFRQTLDTKTGKLWSVPPLTLIPRVPSSEVRRSLTVRSWKLDQEANMRIAAWHATYNMGVAKSNCKDRGHCHKMAIKDTRPGHEFWPKTVFLFLVPECFLQNQCQKH